MGPFAVGGSIDEAVSAVLSTGSQTIVKGRYFILLEEAGTPFLCKISRPSLGRIEYSVFTTSVKEPQMYVLLHV